MDIVWVVVSHCVAFLAIVLSFLATVQLDAPEGTTMLDVFKSEFRSGVFWFFTGSVALVLAGVSIVLTLLFLKT
jgi:hypothetical protein